MIFGTSQYWAADSMQWKLNAERAVQPKWETTEQPAATAAAEPIFRLAQVDMQAQLRREQAR